MKDIEKIIADLKAWVEENSENRAIALVAVQKTEETEEKNSSDLYILTKSLSGYLVDAFQYVLSDNAPKKGLHKVLLHVIRREAKTGLTKISDPLLKKSDKKSENSSEEGKEADHE